MKTSNKLVLLIALVFFGAIVGSAMVLKQTYDNIDFDDPYYGYARNDVGAFHHIKLEGEPWGRVNIKPGEASAFLHPADAEVFEYEVREDTLFVAYTADAPREFRATAYILAPEVISVHSEGFGCQLIGWQGDSLRLSYAGTNGFLALNKGKLSKISASLSERGTLNIGEGNQIGSAHIEVKDESSLIVEGGQVDTLYLDADPKAKIQLPGALLDKVKY